VVSGNNRMLLAVVMSLTASVCYGAVIVALASDSSLASWDECKLGVSAKLQSKPVDLR